MIAINYRSLTRPGRFPNVGIVAGAAFCADDLPGRTGTIPQEGSLIEFIPGRRYRVQSEVGEIIGTFVKKEGGKLKFSDVVRIVEASHEGEESLTTAGIYDAEPWLQTMDFGDTSNSSQAKRAITDVRRRKGVVVKRAAKAR